MTHKFLVVIDENGAIVEKTLIEGHDHLNDMQIIRDAEAEFRTKGQKVTASLEYQVNPRRR